MSVRELSYNEMYHLPRGSEAVVIKPVHGLPVGHTLRRGHHMGTSDDDHSCCFSYDNGMDYHYFRAGEVGVVELDKHQVLSVRQLMEQTQRPAEELGVYRPELETRKIGKIRVELVDEGFPLALREVAQVMTWAQTAKGYKDHDWQNLPNAEVALAAAASRHRTDHIKQRVVDDLPIDQCVDGESGLLHKAHEAFGVLAQLELMLRGKFVDSRPQIGV